MAQVTMDSSENEALKKNIHLLEDARLKEQALFKKIEQLKEEKIQVLRNNERNVSIINKTTKSELYYVKRNFDNIVLNMRQFLNFNNDMRHRSMDEVINLFFEKKEDETVEKEEVTLKGFEEVKRDVKTKYLKELSDETKKQIDNIVKLREKIEKDAVTILGFNLDKMRIKELEEEIKRLKDNNQSYVTVLSDRNSELEKIWKIVHGKWSIFNFMSKLEKLKEL